MAKRRISAKEAVAAIRLGMDDSALMKEYGLAPSGLQSLFDKLVTSGYIDLAEIQGRMPGYLGTVNIADPFLPSEGDGNRGAPQPQTGKSGAWINAQEAARDIRAGLDFRSTQFVCVRRCSALMMFLSIWGRQPQQRQFHLRRKN
jgi:hypothetical protein